MKHKGELSDTLRVTDHVSGTVIRDGRVVGFSESVRDGRAASADVDTDHVLEGITGPPPQNETGTLGVARTLVHVLNTLGGTFGQPEAGQGLVDAHATDKEGRKLKMQVVRSRVDPAYWKALDKAGVFRDARHVVALAAEIRSSIAKKESIGLALRGELTLVVSAMDTPCHVMDNVVDAFRAAHGDEIRILGFQAIWLVGPTPLMTHRLA